MTKRYAQLNQALAENRVERAEELCRELLQGEPDSVELLTLKGALARQRGGVEEALQAFSRAAQLNPALAELRNNLGVILQDLGRHEEAATSFREALAQRGSYPEACCNLGNALLKLGRSGEAIASYSDAIALDPCYADAYYNLGHALRGEGDWQGAVQCYRRVVELKPSHLKAWVNLGGSHFALNDFEEAIRAQRRALELDPECVDAHWNLALLLLAAGDYREGWREYQWRLKDPAARFSDTLDGKKMWDGSPLAGRTLLVRSEQGFGDAIQFFRYAQLLARRGERVVFECRRELLPLFAAQGGEIVFFPAGEEPPPFDTFVYLLSLPHLLGTALESIPEYSSPLAADAGLVSLWRERMPGGSRKVGLVWAGSAGYKNDRYRSLPAAALSPLSELPGVNLYNLQLGASRGELAAIGTGSAVRDLTGEIRDFSDTAAIIANLELVVTVDTAVAHLAGAMGKRVCLLLPFSCEWRWLSGRADSPWYPGVKIYRQERLGEWEGVIASVAGDLARGSQAATVPGEGDPNLLFRKANGLRSRGEPAQAVRLYRALLTRIPDCAEVHNNLGLALEDQGVPEQAEASYRRALELEPGLADAHNNLGTLLVSRGEHEKALPFFLRALELRDDYLPAYVNLGSCLQVLEAPEEAVELYLRAIALDPRYLEARINLGTAWQELMQPEKAIEVYREILLIAPEHPEAHWNLALSLLFAGEFERGFSEYEWRLAGQENGSPAVPVWQGEELHGRTILIECEQGLGDTLQFVRYAPLVAKRGGRVVLQCQIPGLKPLMERVPGVAAVHSRGEVLPPCDCRVKLLSLPHIFGTTLERMPAWQPYLIPEKRRAALWDLLLDAGSLLKVGLVWRGGALPRNRACPFKEFAPLADMSGISFYSLQLGEEPDRDILQAVDLAPKIGDFGDSSAILAGLDLLITVDTAAAHLAGGMGVPVWLMLPYACDWRWLSGRKDSPWYPSLRIFRQERPGDWPGVVHRIGEALEWLLNRR